MIFVILIVEIDSFLKPKSIGVEIGFIDRLF